MNLPTYYDYIETQLNYQLQLDNTKFVESKNFEQMDELVNTVNAKLSHIYRNWSIFSDNDVSLDNIYNTKSLYRTIPNEVTKGQFRPLIHKEHGGHLGQLMDFFYTGWVDNSYVERIEQTKKLLMVSHGFSIPDPFPDIIRMHRSYLDSEFSDSEKTKQAFINFLNYLYAIKDCIKANIISFYPSEELALYKSSIEQFTQVRGKAFEEYVLDNKAKILLEKDTNFAEFKDKYFGDDEFLFLFRTGLGMALSRYNEIMFFAHRYNTTASFSLEKYGRWLPHFNSYHENKELRILDNQRYKVNRMSMDAICKLKIPDLDSLKFTDIAKIRQDNAHLEAYRSTLSHALSECINLGMEDKALIVDHVQHEIYKSQQALNNDLKGLAFKNIFTQSGKGLVVGSITAAGVATVNPIASAAMLGGGALWDYLAKHRERNDLKTVSNLYACWD